MGKLSWDSIQRQSDEILSDGLYKLKTRPYCDFSTLTDKGFGNYLISLDKVPYYIGEAKELNKRLKQQFNPATSTFYKNFQKLTKNELHAQNIVTDKFKVQFISTFHGRKEIEEFGIVNLPTRLNKFQLDKRNKISIADQKGLWDKVQLTYSGLLKEGETKILKTKFIPWFETEIFSAAGIYLVKNKSDNLIYIGESSNIGERISTHSGRTYFSALRRHIGTEILDYTLQEKDGRKRYFSDTEDKKVTEFLKTCKALVFPVNFGRYEFEEYLIKKHRPLLNRKDNKN